ncbi:23S rRNA (uracil(1939)-C(5))-methyltransferase RlmD [Marinobacterium nitratireducens]|uniref:23S rRNA (uracil(1939)-C(5))-methyltransferase RlmD n=1 Tax=Marinobacterium nitratireducens TaxID=518897 RepID=A0A917ZCU7_9GAMM|nr:23S rRNA (uracil(1939)-C(5))-methyltransferase RlmD [Marinobacterium nitratireducens]GGO80635.1 23S rRNA (uracil(1939)-C(5))-methyltransferase RlmD [Marinobacterium nitratireducens]
MSRRPIRFGGPARASSRRQNATPDLEELQIERLSHEGRGVARAAGKTVFVAGALPGERVRARLLADRSRYCEAEMLEVLEASPDRTEPGCSHYRQCGGCDLQHLRPQRQIAFKQEQALDQLSRLGKLAPEHVEAPLVSLPWHYRRSARIGINQLQRNAEPLVGFRRRASNKLLAIEQCEVLDPRAQTLFVQLRQALAECGDIKQITHAQVQYGDQAGALTLRVKKALDDSTRTRLQACAEALELELYIESDAGIRYAGKGTPAPLQYSLPAYDVVLDFAPGDFLQVNADLNRQMVSRALDWLAPTAQDRVLDLFCGLGNFTLPLARHSAEVVGIEGSAEMVERATANARRNGLGNVRIYRQDLSQDFRHQGWYRGGFDLILLDPPRTGAREAVQQLTQYRARRVLYVACNPAALARDGAELAAAGYRLSRFCVMDMFPHTAHVEALALFELAP